MYWQRILRKTHHQIKKFFPLLWDSCSVCLQVRKFTWEIEAVEQRAHHHCLFIVAHKCHSLSWCGKQPWCSSPCTPALANHFSIPIICKSTLAGALLSSRRIKLICILHWLSASCGKCKISFYLWDLIVFFFLILHYAFLCLFPHWVCVSTWWVKLILVVSWNKKATISIHLSGTWLLRAFLDVH